MQTIKQIVHSIADNLPEQATLEDVMHTLYVFQKLRRSLKAAEEGKRQINHTLSSSCLNV